MLKNLGSKNIPTVTLFMFLIHGASLVVQLVKNPPTMQETWV